jgi:hypothetical protein
MAAKAEAKAEAALTARLVGFSFTYLSSETGLPRGRQFFLLLDLPERLPAINSGLTKLTSAALNLSCHVGTFLRI